MKLSSIVVSNGTRSLDATLHSITTQLQPPDELIVDFNSDPFGNEARNRCMAKATGSHILICDDDDVYRPDAFATIRSAIKTHPDRVHIFKMQVIPSRGGNVVPNGPILEVGNVSTQCFIIPNHDLGKYTDRHEGDFDFIVQTLQNQGTEPIWHDEIIVDFGMDDVTPTWLES